MPLDIGVGILLGILYHALNTNLGLSTTVLFGIFAALAPDFDFVFHLSKGGRTTNSHRHREVLHNPLIFIPLGMAITALFEPRLAVLFGLGALAHFIHDSIGLGWGVRWLYPFKNVNYALGYRIRTGNHAKLPRQKLYAWPNEQIDELARKYGDPNWFNNTYLKLHPFAIFEVGVLVLALVALYLYAS